MTEQADTSSIIDFDEITCNEISNPAVRVKNPLASVCMITYNHAPYIAQAIEGVLQQKTSFPFELVIGEDCSTDRTRDVVLQYQKQNPERVHVILPDRNLGLVKNFSQTEAACRGQYIAYCEGDDYWHHAEKLQTQVDFLERNPEYALTHSNAHLHVVKTGQLKPSEQKRCQDILSETLDPSNGYLEILANKRWIWTLTVCTRKALVDQVVQHCPECHEERYLMGDIQRWLELARLGRIMYCEEPLATRNQLEESASNSNDPAKLATFGLVGNALVEHYLNKYPCPPTLRETIQRDIIMENLTFAWMLRDREMANEQYHRLKAGKEKIPLRYRIRYWGTKYPLLHGLIGMVLSGKRGVSNHLTI